MLSIVHYQPRNLRFRPYEVSRIWGSDHLKEKGSVSKKTINKPGVKAPYAALKIVHLSVVSSRQR